MQKSSFKDIIRNDSITNNTKVVVPRTWTTRPRTWNGSICVLTHATCSISVTFLFLNPWSACMQRSGSRQVVQRTYPYGLIKDRMWYEKAVLRERFNKWGRGWSMTMERVLRQSTPLIGVIGLTLSIWLYYLAVGAFDRLAISKTIKRLDNLCELRLDVCMRSAPITVLKMGQRDPL